MNNVEVKKAELLKIVKSNKTKHRNLFLKAQKGYRKAVIEELDRMLNSARKGHKIIRHISLPEPEDHTSDYDRVITMLSMSIDKTIKLSEQEFKQYVMDNWAWSAMTYTTNSSYAI